MQPKKLSERASRGFTLIELLVVVAIIAVLISILLPALGLAKKQAKQLLCNTNLRSMGQAMMLYADEYNGYTVRAELDTNNPRTDDRVHFSTALITSNHGVQRDRRRLAGETAIPAEVVHGRSA